MFGEAEAWEIRMTGGNLSEQDSGSGATRSLFLRRARGVGPSTNGVTNPRICAAGIRGFVEIRGWRAARRMNARAGMSSRLKPTPPACLSRVRVAA